LSQHILPEVACHPFRALIPENDLAGAINGTYTVGQRIQDEAIEICVHLRHDSGVQQLSHGETGNRDAKRLRIKTH
jgi:hypothetical protein